jgi:hypothetical protein
MLNGESILIRAGLKTDAAALAAFAARTFEETFGADNRPDDLRAHLSNAFCGSTVFHVGPDPQIDRVMIAPVSRARPLAPGFPARG